MTVMERYMAMKVMNFAQPGKRTVWGRLGFGSKRIPRFEDDEHPDLAPHWMTSHVIGVLDWKDRLRVLISGKIEVVVSTKTDVPVTKAVSKSNLGVLPPSYHVKAQ